MAKKHCPRCRGGLRSAYVCKMCKGVFGKKRKRRRSSSYY